MLPLGEILSDICMAEFSISHLTSHSSHQVQPHLDSLYIQVDWLIDWLNEWTNDWISWYQQHRKVIYNNVPHQCQILLHPELTSCWPWVKMQNVNNMLLIPSIPFIHMPGETYWFALICINYCILTDSRKLWKTMKGNFLLKCENGIFIC